MRVIVLGGTGQLGSRLAMHFREEGCDVVATSRTAGVSPVPNASAPLVRFDPLHDPWSSLGTCHLLINTIGAMSDNDEEMRTAHIGLPERIAAYHTQLGAPYVFHLSALGARIDHPAWFLRSKAVGDEFLLRSLGSRASVVRPSIVCTPGTRIVQKIKTLRAIARRTGGVIACPRRVLECRLQPVLIEDVAALFHALATEPSRRSVVINVGGQEQYTLRALLEEALSAERIRLRVFPLPLALCQRAVAYFPRWLAQQIASREEFRLLEYDNIVQSSSLSSERSYLGSSTRAFFKRSFATG